LVYSNRLVNWNDLVMLLSVLEQLLTRVVNFPKREGPQKKGSRAFEKVLRYSAASFLFSLLTDFVYQLLYLSTLDICYNDHCSEEYSFVQEVQLPEKSRPVGYLFEFEYPDNQLHDCKDFGCGTQRVGLTILFLRRTT
jgi:hypothetical protein